MPTDLHDHARSGQDHRLNRDVRRLPLPSRSRGTSVAYFQGEADGSGIRRATAARGSTPNSTNVFAPGRDWKARS